MEEIINPDLTGIAMEEFWVPSDTPGIELYVRYKYLAKNRFQENKGSVLFVHGSSYPSEVSFDLRVGGFSWMDYIALQGWSVFMMDLRGYGKSSRPPEMEETAQKNPPVVRTETAVRDVNAVVENIVTRMKQDSLSLIGWSWGSTVMAAYTCSHASRVDRLVLYAPQWLRTTPSLLGGNDILGAYRYIPINTTKDRWLNGVAPEQREALIPAGWYETWAEATLASDPAGCVLDCPGIRAPNGIIQDSREFWSNGKVIYSPADITVPVLVIGGEWDADTPQYMAQGVFEHLTQAPAKRRVIIGGGTHTLLLEKHRMQLLKEVQLFLDETSF